MLLLFLLKLLFTNPIAFLIAIFLLILPLLMSIALHEWSHGMVAYLFGDPTPKKQGRLTLNPFAHLDPVGTLLLLVIGFGWAKPVEINPDNIHGRTKQMLVGLAGPFSNITLAFIVTVIVYLIQYHSGSAEPGIFTTFLGLVIQINIILAIFNMLPIPPLDGSRLIQWLLPERLAEEYYSKIAPFSIIILILLLYTVGGKYIFGTAQVIEEYMFKLVRIILSPIIS